MNTLQQFLPKLSKQCGLSRIFTNHSIRSTAATLLHQDNFDPTAVKSITGHKSLSSLAVYQRTSSEQKIEMAQALHSKIAGRHSVATATIVSASQGASSTTDRGDSLPTISSLPDLGDLNGVFDDIYIPEDISFPASFPPGLGLFNNCNIGSVSVVYKFGP